MSSENPKPDRLLDLAFFTVWNRRRVVRWLQYSFLFFTAVLCGRIAAKAVYLSTLSQY